MLKVSVIVPVYNGEDYIENCIKNVLNQTLKDFELIIINDGSSDNTLNICREYCDIDNRIKLISQSNQGVSTARNKGIKVSKGEYICFIDCDDKIDINYIESLYNACEKNNVMMSCCTVESIGYNYGECNLSKTMNDGNYKNIEALEELFKFRNLNWGPCGKIFHKSLIKENIEFPNLNTYEDLAFVYKAIYKANKIYFTTNCKYYYIHKVDDGAMYNFIKSPTIDVIVVADEILDFIKMKRLPIWDKSFYGIVSQVIMYINNIDWKENSSKIYIKGTSKLLAKYRIDILKSKIIPYKEKILLLILSYSYIGSRYIYRNRRRSK
ncbi:MAG: glycosyltransferase family 2 protein [Terrisporobacter othiniensis]|uniref:glycosyltransferase family 2 protein n=1 Tax=Terrisporobacter othiniensis TaxID=1577792 RepID=UPI0029102E40|nr:glycosyltransferase family 2 protein [Terrisporobacter othiniensis]MDU6983128.1 glycosyltransferase family 2 protein [Terrisporobacter othiniensis]